MIGVVVAHPKELKKFNFDLIKQVQINQFEFNVFQFAKTKVVVVLSGVGIANSAAATQQLITSFKVTEVFNYGAVGGNADVNIYDVIYPQKIYYHDVVTPWYKHGQTPGEKEFYLNSLIKKPCNNLASGSSFITDNKHIQVLSKKVNVDIFDMECAAIAQVCDKNNIPLKVIKCVSDTIGKTNINKDNILTRISNAGQKAFDIFCKMVNL